MPFVRRLGCPLVRCAGALAVLLLTLPAAWAQGAAPDTVPGVVARPRPWEVALQPPYSPTARDVMWLNDWVVTPIIVVIVVLVAVLIGICLWRFNAKRHPVPSKISHNAPLEIAWTIIPALVLIGMAIPSFKIVFFQNRTTHPYMTLDVTGHQWYWEYKYPDQGNIDFISNIIPQNQLKPGQYRLLSVNHPLVLPVDENIRILQTSGDVIHSFFVPSLGMQRYAIPGQTIETWVRIDTPGTFYGECNQICGLNHHEMAIEIQGVPLPQFLAWAKATEKALASTGAVPPVTAFNADGTLVATDRPTAVTPGVSPTVTKVAQVTDGPAVRPGRGD